MLNIQTAVVIDLEPAPQPIDFPQRVISWLEKVRWLIEETLHMPTFCKTVHDYN